MRLVTIRPIFPLLIAMLLFCCTLAFVAATSYADEVAKKKNIKKATATETDYRGLAIVDKNRDGRKRVALVIGNSKYLSAPLKNPSNDAHDMAVTLRRLGFEVDEKTDLGYVAMNKAVENFGKRLRAGGVGLFYYAGHGVQVQGANYLLPVDAEIDDENEVRYKAVDAGLVLAKMEQARGDVNLVVLDACRNNPFSRSFRSATRGLASMDAPSGSLIAYATAPGKTAADGSSGRNGIYTEELIRMLQIPGLSVEEAFKRVRKAVMLKTANAQVPWESSSLTGDFHFIQPSSMTDLQPSAVQPTPVAAPAPAPQPAARSAGFTDPTTGMEFVNVSGSCFQMGDTFGDDLGWGKPVHEVCVSDFAIGKYEVTQGEYKRIMGSNPSKFSTCGDNCPVEQVSWNDALDFIRKMNSQSGRNYRLPTEAEWEYAARSGGKREKYSGGDNVDAVAWYDGNSGSKTYPSGSQQNPLGPSSGSSRVFRGGSWGDNPWGVRASGRGGNGPGFRDDFLGFRLASPVK